MRIAPRTFFAISALAFIVASGFSFWRLSPAENTGIMSCSTKGIMRFENMEKENVNGNIHFNFGSQGKGSMVVEGYTDSAAGCTCNAMSNLPIPVNVFPPRNAITASASGNPAPHR